MSDLPTNQDAEPLPDGRGVRILSLIAAFFLAAAVILAFTQVVLRFVFNNPQAWAEEVGRYLFVWVTFIGAAVAVAHDSHIRVDALIQKFTPKTQDHLKRFRHVVDLICFAFLLYSGILVAWRNRFSVFYTIEWAPQVAFYLAVPVGCVLMLIFVLRFLFRPRV